MIIVTGGAGFIGSNLVAALEQRGRHDLVVCDRLGQGEKWRNLAKREPRSHHRAGSADGVPRRPRGRGTIEAIFHLGAISSTTEPDADLVVHSNFTLTMRLWEWCAEHGAAFIYASSAATYGDGSVGFDDDGSVAGLARLRPLNSYGWSKHLVDRRIARLIERDAPRPPRWAGLKLFNVYGPNEAHKGDMMSSSPSSTRAPTPARRHGSSARTTPAYPDGGQLRDFVYVRDCVDMLLWLLRPTRRSMGCSISAAAGAQLRRPRRGDLPRARREPAYEFIDTPVELRDKYSISPKPAWSVCAKPATTDRARRWRTASPTM